MLKRILVLILTLSIVFSLFSCEGEKKFTCADLTLTLPSSYREEDGGESANMLLTDGKSTVSIKRLSIIDAEAQGINSSYSDRQFAEFFLINSDIDGVVSVYSDVPYYTYYDTTGGAGLFCLAAFYRTPYAYFIVIFATSSDREREARDEFFEIITSATYQIVN